MAEQSGAPAGPDLSEGIELASLMQGAPLAGHLGEDAVLLVRRGDEVFAVGAHCTHYGGPLAEGLVVGETVRCPLHHACFSLRSGEGSAPALNPLPRWDVVIHDGVVHLGEKRDPPPLDPRGRHVEGPESVVIVGAGAAGSAAVETLLREGYTGPVTLIDPERSAPYDRPNLSKDYLAGSAPEEWIPLRGDGFYEEHGVQRIAAAAQALDPHGRMLTLDDGREISFGALLLATGASPVVPRFDGVDQAHVFTLGSLDDTRRLIAALEESRSAVVVGSGFIGMEAAASMRAREVEVCVVSLDAVPFERTLGPALGGRFQRLHERHGVSFRLGRSVTRIEKERVILDDGSELAADLVLIGVGVRPNVAIAESAGLAVDDGVKVDRHLRTSSPSVFAAGDIARWLDPRWGEARVEHWVVAQRQGQAAARNILGRQEEFRDVPFFWTQQFDLKISYVGHAREWERTEIDGDIDEDCTIRYMSGDATVAVAAVGRDMDNLKAELELERALATHPL